jgi:ABC-type Fe3+-hydroxamate transport system substrate-binding protein
MHLPAHSLHVTTRVTALALLALLAGCGKSPAEALAEKAVSAIASQQAGKKVEVQKNGDTVVIQTEQGTVSMTGGDNVKLPKDFPSDVFLPKDYTVTAVLDMGQARNIGLRTATPPGDLFAEAGAMMKAHGWEQTLAMQQADGGLLAYRKGARMASLTFGRDGEATAMNLQLQDDTTK